MSHKHDINAVSIFRQFFTRYFGICQFFLRYCGIGYPPMSPSKNKNAHGTDLTRPLYNDTLFQTPPWLFFISRRGTVRY